MSLTAEVGMDLMLNLSNAPQAVNDIEKAVGTGVDKGLTGSLKTNQKAVTKSYASALVGALRISNKEAAANLEREFKARSSKIAEESRQIKRREGLLERAQTDFIKKKLRERIAASKALIKQEQAAIKAMADKQNEYQRESLAMLDKGMENAAKGFGEKLEGSVAGFQDLLTSAMGDPSEFIKKMSQGAKDSSSGIFTMGAKMAGGGGKMAGMGKLLMGLGKLLPLIAGVGVAVAGIVAVFMAAYGQAKEFNKSILEGASAVDLLGSDAVGSARDLSDSLAELRGGAMNLAYEFRATSEEVLGFAKAMNDANFTFEEQRKVFGSQQRAMKQALVATQAFGVGGGEIATMVNTMVEDFAFGQNEIATGFDDIFGAAQMSGLGIKNFFTAISEATSGMALYNFRLEDTLELFVGLEKILGEDMGKDVLMGARDKFKEMGTQDRLGFRMKMGSRAFGIVAGAETKKAEESFNTKFVSQVPEALAKVMEGMAPSAFSGGVLDAKALGDLKGAEIGALQNAMRDGGFEDLARQLGNLARVGKGGGALMGEMGVETALAADLMGAVGYLGDTLIYEMSETQRIAFENNQGISGTMLKAYEEIQNRVAGELGPGATATAVGEAIAEGGILTDEETALLEGLKEEAGTTMEDVAKQQLKETRSVLDTLKNGVALVLENIYEVIRSIPMFGGGPSIRDAREKKVEAEKAVEAYKRTIGEDGPTEEQQKVLAGLVAKSGYESRMYQGALGGKERSEVFKELKGGGGLAEAKALGLTKTVRLADLQPDLGPSLGAQGAAAAMAFNDETQDVLIGEGQLTNEHLIALLAAQDETEDQSRKNSKAEVKATEENTSAIKDLISQGVDAQDAALMKLGATGDITDENFDAIRRQLSAEDGSLSPEARAALFARFRKVNDFIYRGDGRSGSITPIDTADQFVGMKPGGAIDRAGGLGRGVVINNLTINESGNPQKTLQMVKQAIAAASAG